MITQEHAQELLQRAQVLAVAASARVNVEVGAELDYGVDGTFRAVTEYVDVNGAQSLLETGSPLRFQLKSTTDCRSNATHIQYDCKVSAYNRLVRQNQGSGVPVLLLVLCLPKQETDWLTATEGALTLRGSCYWYYLLGPQTTNASKQVIEIPREQLFTANVLRDIMSRVDPGGAL